MNSKKIIIFGINDLSEIVCFNLKRQEGDGVIAAFCLDKDYIKDKDYKGTPITPLDSVEAFYPPSEYDFILCMGYSKMNDIRRRKFKEIKEKGYFIRNYIHPTAQIYTEKIGEGNIILENAILGVDCTIGKGNIFYALSHIAHHSQIMDFNFFSVSASIAGNVIIGNNCFFGNNCTVKDGIKIRNYTLVGAGCYIKSDSEENGVYAPTNSIKLKNKTSKDFI